MQTYISLLRGINVSGQKLIRMTDLTDLYKSLNFSNITTYIQSGNVVFQTDKKVNTTKLAKIIEDKITQQYDFKVPVIVRTLEELEKTISLNPFKNEAIEHLYITFLSKAPNSIHIEKVQTLNFLPDKFKLIDKKIYLNVSSYGKTKLTNQFFESKLMVTASTRNWKTLLKLVEIGKDL